MTFPIYGKIKNGNQTTNQILFTLASLHSTPRTTNDKQISHPLPRLWSTPSQFGSGKASQNFSGAPQNQREIPTLMEKQKKSENPGTSWNIFYKWKLLAGKIIEVLLVNFPANHGADDTGEYIVENDAPLKMFDIHC